TKGLTMVPTIEHIIASSVRAMTEVVLPAIDKSDTLALEQAQLVIGILNLIGEQWQKTLPLEHAELREHLRFAAELTKIADGEPKLAVAAREAQALMERFGALAALHVPTYAELREANEQLRNSTQALVAAASTDGDPRFRKDSMKCVLEYAKRQNL